MTEIVPIVFSLSESYNVAMGSVLNIMLFKDVYDGDLDVRSKICIPKFVMSILQQYNTSITINILNTFSFLHIIEK